jgi:putative transposase
MNYTSGGHTVFHHRYHIVWITRYRYKVVEGALRERIRTIIRQVCKELGVQIVSGVLSREHVHMFVEIPPHIAVSDFVRRVKGRSSHRVQMEFPRWSSRTCASAIGDGISGRAATSPPRAATSRTLSYFSIFRSTNLLASAGYWPRQQPQCTGEVLPPSSPALMMAHSRRCQTMLDDRRREN